MIKIDIQMLSTIDLIWAAIAEFEKQISRKANDGRRARIRIAYRPT